MLIIPVIDIKGGRAVAAAGGDRANYQQLETPLAKTSDPVDVAAGLSALRRFSILYIADLDGIERGQSNYQIHADIAAAWPGEALWIDDGGRASSNAVADAATKTSHVIGSESLSVLPPAALPDDAILSLDFQGDRFLGPPALLETQDLWPAKVIVMTLARVGGNGGPDFKKLETIQQSANGRSVFAAGGVRNAQDLRQLQAHGIAGALISTALHSGQLTSEDLAAFQPDTLTTPPTQ